MRLRLDCGLSFQLWWLLIVTIEILFSIVIMGFGFWEYYTRIGYNAMLEYAPGAKEDYRLVNGRYTIVVTCWILLLLFCLCLTRIFSSLLLTVGVKRSSAELAKIWIVCKVFEITISLFLVTASFTVSDYVKIATLLSLMTDLMTAYFIRILYPELEKMKNFIVMVDPEIETSSTTKEKE